MKNFYLGFALAAVLVAGGYWIVSQQATRVGPATSEPKAGKFYCPMHPDYVSDTAGDCPICNMKLVPMKAEASPAAAPEQHLPEPHAPAEAAYAPVTIAPERLQMMGITTAEATTMTMSKSIRTVGIVKADETRIHHVHTKFEGYIEEIYADFTGQFVRRGQPLFSIYSPELEATQREYLLALRARERLLFAGAGPHLAGIDLVAAARQRLALWDISQEQIAEIEARHAPIRALTIHSPASGFVAAKTAVLGYRVTPADTLYDIIDLSAIWILADLYETDLPFVKIGDPAVVSLPYGPNRTFRGHIAYIDPVLDGTSRTAKARIEMANPAGLFKPDMYAEIEIAASLGRGLMVPESAVMETGERSIVFVARDGGLFEPRTVVTGARVRGYYEIRSGLAEGERVVAGANFLLDSESRLRAAVSAAAHGRR